MFRFTVLAVVGSACFWATGYLSFLSPALFLMEFPGSINIEYAYFSSQASAALFSGAVCLWARRTGRFIPDFVVILAAAALAAVTMAEAFATTLAPDNQALMVLLGICDGLCWPVLVAAWGARYTWESRHLVPVIAVSFLLAYGLFFLISLAAPSILSAALTVSLPLVSALLWYIDLRGRKRMTPELWYSGQPPSASGQPASGSSASGQPAPGQLDSASEPSASEQAACGWLAFGRLSPGRFASRKKATGCRQALKNNVDAYPAKYGIPISEITAGETSLGNLPVHTLAVLGIAALAGDFISSVMLGFGYENADVISNGGFSFGALFVLAFALLLIFGRWRFSVGHIYRWLLPLVSFGLLYTLVFGNDGQALSIGILRGTGLLFQVLVLIIIAQLTRNEGISPVLAFSLGLVVTSGLTFLGQVSGKLYYLGLGDSQLAIRMAIAITIILLIVVVSTLAPKSFADQVPEDGEGSGTAASGDAGLGGAAGGVAGARGEAATGGGAMGGAAGERGVVLRGAVGGNAMGGNAMVGGAMGGDSASSVETDAVFDELFAQRVQGFAAAHGLSKRECEVVGLLVRGRSTPYIAAQLHVTSGTIKTHLVHIYRKLEVSGRQGLIDLFDNIGVE